MATPSTKRRKDAGERLKGERERLGYAPRQIAQLLGVPLEAYDAFESGTADPGIWRMPRLAACCFPYAQDTADYRRILPCCYHAAS